MVVKLGQILIYHLVEFLAFSRNLCNQGHIFDEPWTLDSSSQPLESDELALNFLHQHDYDVEMAKFHLMIFHGQGKGMFIFILKYFVFKKSLQSDSLLYLTKNYWTKNLRWWFLKKRRIASSLEVAQQ